MTRERAKSLVPYSCLISDARGGRNVKERGTKEKEREGRLKEAQRNPKNPRKPQRRPERPEH